MLSSLFLRLLAYFYQERKWLNARMLFLLRLSHVLLVVLQVLLIMLLVHCFHLLAAQVVSTLPDAAVFGSVVGTIFAIALVICFEDHSRLREKTYCWIIR